MVNLEHCGADAVMDGDRTRHSLISYTVSRIMALNLFKKQIQWVHCLYPKYATAHDFVIRGIYVPQAFRIGYSAERERLIFWLKPLILMVGAEGFEPPALCSQIGCPHKTSLHTTAHPAPKKPFGACV